MEAAFYGGMKLDVRRGTHEEMDLDLLEIAQSIIFCRGSAEAYPGRHHNVTKLNTLCDHHSIMGRRMRVLFFIVLTYLRKHVCPA